VPQTSTFGRRNQASPRSPPSPARRPDPAPRTESRIGPKTAPPKSDLSPEAEAFRAELAAGRGAKSGDFSDWRRVHNRERWLIWGLTLLSFTPGIATFLLDAPIELSGGLELAAMIGNVWLRTARRRRLRDIVSWESPNPPP
jgi:hypothetical protein